MSVPETTPTAGLTRLLSSKEVERRSPDEYRRLVKDHYNGLAGWFTYVSGFFTGHESLAENVFGPGKFDLTGCRRILDAGCGNGRYLKAMRKFAGPDAEFCGCDLSEKMLERAARRFKDRAPALLAADVTRLPYADNSFDAVVCGWVLEHLPDPALGVKELARVLRPSGKMLLMVTETNLFGAICSRFYHNRMMSRAELRAVCDRLGLDWGQELWWSRWHRLIGAGGIVVELRKRPNS
jgi:SAM-dependent methyltransferase